MENNYFNDSDLEMAIKASLESFEDENRRFDDERTKFFCQSSAATVASLRDQRDIENKEHVENDKFFYQTIAATVASLRTQRDEKRMKSEKWVM